MNQTASKPTNAELFARRVAAVPRGIGNAFPIFAERALNSEIFDVEGNRYIDFCAGIAVVNTGHCHPRVMEAAKAQMDKFTHTCFQVVAYEDYIALAERLANLAPGSAPKKAFFMNTGAEAVENAIKVARAYTKRSGIIAFRGAFHGRSMFSLSLTGKVDPYKIDFGPFPAEVFHARYPNAYQGVSVDDAMADLEALFKNDIQASHVAAIFVEPVQGEGGYIPAPAEFLQRLRALCDQHGILLVADEVQTGVGRTGKFFAIEHAGVVPDIITMAKGLGGGLTLSAVVGRADVLDAAVPGGLGSTYGGHPLALAGAQAVLDVVEDEKLCERAAAIGAKMQDRFNALKAKYDCIGDVRGLGAMVAVEFSVGGDPHKPAAAVAAALKAECQKRGLLILTCGIYGNVLRLMTPLTIQDNILEEGLAILEAAMAVAAQAA